MDKDFNEFTEEDFESEDFDEKAFRDKVVATARKDLDTTPNIGECIKITKNNLKQIEENFNAIWEAYKMLKKAITNEEWKFIDAKARTLLCYALNKVLCAFVRSDACDELLLLNKSIDASLAELREEKKLLANIRSAVKELQKYNIDECNYDMALLLALINEKNALLLTRLNEEVYALGVRIKGINYASNKKTDEDLALVNENIDYKVQRLELTHRY